MLNCNALRAVVDCYSTPTDADGHYRKGCRIPFTNPIAIVLRAMKTSSETQLLSIQLRKAVGTFSNRTSISSTGPTVGKLEQQLLTPDGD